MNKTREKKVSTRVGPLRQGKEPIKTNDKEKAELINEQVFVNIGKELAEKLPSSTENNHSLIYRVTPVMKDVQISHEKMTKHINKVKPGKSSGRDNGMSTLTIKPANFHLWTRSIIWMEPTKPAKLHQSWRLELMEYRWKQT